MAFEVVRKPNLARLYTERDEENFIKALSFIVPYKGSRGWPGSSDSWYSIDFNILKSLRGEKKKWVMEQPSLEAVSQVCRRHWTWQSRA
jgi:hypothetical protein